MIYENLFRISSFSLCSCLDSQTFIMSQRHKFTALFTIWISVQITNNGLLIYLVKFLSLLMNLKKSYKLQKTHLNSNGLQISTPINQQPKFPHLSVPEVGISASCLDPLPLSLILGLPSHNYQDHRPKSSKHTHEIKKISP